MKTLVKKIVKKLDKYSERVLLSLIPSSVVKRGEFESSVSDNDWYIRSVKSFLRSDYRFKNFKRSQIYREVLEHVTLDQAKKYLDQIENNNPKFLTETILGRVSVNDLVGNPPTFDFGRYGRLSGPTIRYLKVCADLDEFFDVNKIGKIAEIGGGYGGQALVFDQLFYYQKYTIFDLALVCDLINKYLGNYFLQGGIEAFEINKLSREGSLFDLVISNYAFSELPKKLQNIYLEKVILRSRRGYMTMNTGNDLKGYSRESRLNCSELLELLPNARVVDEIPLTDPRNYILVWGED